MGGGCYAREARRNAEWLIFEFAAVFGFGLATVFRQSASAIGPGLGYVLVIEMLVFALLVQLGVRSRPLTGCFPMANSPTHAVVVLSPWIVGIAAVCAALVRRRGVL
ncbi:MAG TPA: hypothetical protein VIA06_24725 [Candidatus Dormibacteraeota bacterium]|nr:hypothetical protein [Candidatus Dormibacteraeota bacterium]